MDGPDTRRPAPGCRLPRSGRARNCLDPLLITYLLTCSLRDLRGFDREVLSEVDRELMVLVGCVTGR
eukprot:1910769-Prymnesium_polylepis.1